MIETATAIGAAAWASYLVNCDAGDLDPIEIELADKWIERFGSPLSCDGDAYFSWGFGVVTGWLAHGVNGGELLEYQVAISTCNECDGAGGFGERGTCGDCEGSGTNVDPRNPGTINQ